MPMETRSTTTERKTGNLRRVRAPWWSFSGVRIQEEWLIETCHRGPGAAPAGAFFSAFQRAQVTVHREWRDIPEIDSKELDR